MRPPSSGGNRCTGAPTRAATDTRIAARATRCSTPLPVPETDPRPARTPAEGRRSGTRRTRPHDTSRVRSTGHPDVGALYSREGPRRTAAETPVDRVSSSGIRNRRHGHEADVPRPPHGADHGINGTAQLFRPTSELQLPCLGHEVVAREAPVALLADELEARLLIDAPRGEQFALGPQRDLAIARSSREPDRVVHQPRAHG